MDHAGVVERGLEPGQLLDGGAPPDALIGGNNGAVVSLSDEDRDDLVGEGAIVLRGRGPFVGQRGILVEPGAGESPLLGDHLRRKTLVEREIVIAGKHFGAVGLSACPRRAERHPAHHLYSAGHHHVLLAGHHRLHGEVERLLAGAARPVDRGARNAFGPAGGQHRVTADVARLIADLRHTSPHHVVDDVRVDSGALHELSEHDGRQVGGVHASTIHHCACRPASARPRR